MNKTIFDIAISLDGFIAGDNCSPQNTIGDGGMALHSSKLTTHLKYNLKRK